MTTANDYLRGKKDGRREMWERIKKHTHFMSGYLIFDNDEWQKLKAELEDNDDLVGAVK